MKVAFEGVHSIANVAISVPNIPGSVEESCASEFLEFTTSSALAYILLVSGYVV
jgi:hypothetical protein